MSRPIKQIAISYCEGPLTHTRLYEGKTFTSYRDVDRILNQLAPDDPEILGYFKCGVVIVFDNDVTYEARLELTQVHRSRHAILLPHVISHCEVMSGRVVPPHYRDNTDRWTKVLDQLEESNPDMRANYAMFLDAYFT